MRAVTGEHEVSDELIKAYLAGHLTASESAALEQNALADDELAANILLIRSMVEAGAMSSEAETSMEFGWMRLSRALARQPGGLGEQQKYMPGLWRMVAAAVLAVAAWQFAVVPFLDRPTSSKDSYTLASRQDSSRFSATATFVPEAPEAAIRRLLLDVGADIIAGPSALGVYQLAFTTQEDLDAGTEILRTQAGVITSIEPN